MSTPHCASTSPISSRARQKLLTDADTQLKAAKYNEAKAIFVTASTLKPIEKLPKDKIAEIEGILSEIKSKDENYTKALNSAAEFYAAKNPEAAIKTYEEASLLKPGEKYPQERISAIKAELKVSDDNYKNAIALGDSKLASKNLMEALNAYQNALEIKPSENFPKTKIAEINTMLLAQKEEMEKMYASYIADGDALFNSKDYFGAKSAYTKAAGIKPDESYPKQRLTETNKIVEEIELTRKAEYAKALGEADKLYNTKIFDQAIDAYEAASKINPSDSYPENQINKIRKYISDHAIQDLYSQAFQITEGNEKKFTFSSIEPRLRKNNYILLKARSTGKSSPKVYLNYGKDSQKNGGIVLRSLDKTVISDYMIRISVQDKWYREDNNWISIYVETGDVEITKVQIAAGDE
jgi:tetratricopeptide (TPR) repeat protein